MKTALLTSALAAILLAGLPADASPKGNRGNGNGNGNGAWSEGEFCPPGLRHRSPACVPPGQARHDQDEGDDDRDDGTDHADRVEEELGDLVQRVDLSRDERQALAIIGGLMGLALYEQRRRAADEAEPAPAPTVARLAIPQAPPLRPAWIEALAPTYFGDAAADDADAALPPRPVALSPLLDPVPVPAPAASTSTSTSLIPPPPPLADDVTDLIGGSVSDSGF